MFNPSLLQVIRYRPWRWTDATQTAKQELNGVFILMSDALIELLAAKLTEAQKTELRQWAHRVTVDQAGEWHVPVYAGDDRATFIRVPATVWNDPTTTPPVKVRNYFQHLYNQVT